MSFVEEVFERRPRRRRFISRRTLIKTVIIAVLMIAVIVASVILFSRAHYQAYKTVTSREETDNVSRFSEFGGRIVMYSSNGVSLLNDELYGLWNYSVNFINPAYESTEKNFIVYDKNSTGISLFNKTGNIGNITCDKTIIAAKPSENNCVAVLLYDGSEYSVKYYGASGETLAEASITFDGMGVPSDIEISKDGKCLAVALESIADSGVETKVMFCRFNGQDTIKDNTYFSDTYTDNVTAKLVYADNNTFAALMDDGFCTFGSGAKLRAISDVRFTDDIISAFYDRRYLGFVFKSNSDKGYYRMEIYSYSGRKISEFEFGLDYDDIMIKDDSIIVNNKSEYEIYSLKGILRSKGSISEGTVREFVKIRKNKYFAATDSVIELLKCTDLSFKKV